MTITLILLAIAIVGFRFLIPKLGHTVAGGPVERNGQQQLTDCPDTPNCQGSQSSREEQIVEPLAIGGGAGDAIARIANALSAESSVAIVTQDDRYLHLTYTTRLMAYTDDVEFLLDEAAGVVHIRSASRIGQSDLGANAKRIDAIRSRLNGVL